MSLPPRSAFFLLAACLALLGAGTLLVCGSAPGPPPAGALPGTLTRFVDVADQAGLRYAWKLDKRPLTILSTIGNGCAFWDYNNDGNLDVLLVAARPGLFQGDGKGRFRDVTRTSGLAALGPDRFLGCAVGDVNNDGWPDLYLSGWRTGRLLKNQNGAYFQDVTRAMKLAPQPWGTSCGFADLDNDGWLDLYVAGYVEFGPETKNQCCAFEMKDTILRSACGPSAYPSRKGVLYRNQAGVSFRDVTAAWGANAHSGHGLGVAFADFDASGSVDFAVANDDVAGDLFQNGGGDRRLKNVGAESGTAFEPGGDVHGGMGADWGDHDNDGDLDLFVATFRDEVKSLYRNDGQALFSDVSPDNGVERATWPYVAFGAKFLDADNDGWLDLMLANGHVKDVVHYFEDSKFRQPPQLLHNKGGRAPTYQDISATAGRDFARTLLGRGLAVGDYDNDGRWDALVVDNEGKPLLLHNESAVPKGAWIGFRLVTPGGSTGNRDAYGAVVTVTVGEHRWVRQCQPGGSYLSSSDPRVHFGLGRRAGVAVAWAGTGKVDRVAVRWPDGTTQTWHNVPSGRYFTLTQGQPLPTISPSARAVVSFGTAFDSHGRAGR